MDTMRDSSVDFGLYGLSLSTYGSFVSVLLLSILFLTGCVSTQERASSPGYEEALAALNQGHYRVARERFSALAEAGDAYAQFELGMMYTQGLGVAYDPAAAAVWLRKASAQDLALAQNELAILYLPVA